MSRRLDGDPMTATCPDCSAVAVGNSLEHDATCPVGIDADANTAADALFFEQHPATREYWRPVTLAEIVELRTIGIFPDVPGHGVGQVLVRQLAPGLRSRDFGRVVYVLDET